MPALPYGTDRVAPLLVDYVSFRILILYQKKSKLLTTVPASAYIQTSKGRLYTGTS